MRLCLSKLSLKEWVLLVVSFIAAAFGQPAFLPWLGPFAAIAGYALFWAIVVKRPEPRVKFWIGMAWFTAVQLVQLSWFISHPYAYIYIVYFALSLGVGAQFGFLCRYITCDNVTHLGTLIGLAALWTLLEWSRLFVLSGFTWNPIGLALTTQLTSMQMAALWGVYGLTFLVAFVNLLALRTWLLKKGILIWIAAALLPYLYGIVHLKYHEAALARLEEKQANIQAILVQTAFPAEEALGIHSRAEFIAYVFDEWKQILSITKKQAGKHVDLIVLPEFVVPLGTYTFVYPYEQVKEAFTEFYGPNGLKALPPLESPFATPIAREGEKVYFVNNAFWSQAIANFFDAPTVVGLEDAEAGEDGKIEYYSAAIAFQPASRISAEERKNSAYNCPFHVDRYEKRVLVPMGEYIPFEFLRDLAAKYGVGGSFTPGKEAKVFNCGPIPFGLSICYEETFGDLMRQSRCNGAELLVNLTSDVWYPDSRLAQQHFDHARLRAIENGIPLVRACNTGITCAVDSLGRLHGVLDEYDKEGKWLSDSLLVSVPRYTYHTIYSHLGDGLIIGFCIIATLLFFWSLKRKK